ncbi:hypothetical protein B0H12DRAFT_557752 [Mycena haematopus]|nr:hypothetical protein B0H12DRAFT_557752 [Mycena haematopus]
MGHPRLARLLTSAWPPIVLPPSSSQAYSRRDWGSPSASTVRARQHYRKSLKVALYLVHPPRRPPPRRARHVAPLRAPSPLALAQGQHWREEHLMSCLWIANGAQGPNNQTPPAFHTMEGAQSS